MIQGARRMQPLTPYWRVAARIGAAGRRLGDRLGVGMEDVANCAVAADQDELARTGRGAERLKQQEHPLDRDVDGKVRRFLHRGQVKDVGHPLHGGVDGGGVGDGAPDDPEVRGRVQPAVVADRHDLSRAGVGQGAQRPEDVPSDLAGGAGDQQPHRSPLVRPFRPRSWHE
ncbi:MAG: hypothetical protein MUE98_11755 [Rhodobacteraceae bacterium]|nr:hypothetical protein [Paracoccaceae bacterium]